MSDKKTRKNYIMVRLNDDELEQIKPQAQKFDLSLAVYVRNCALKNKITAKSEKKIYAKYTNQLAWIGNNLNQIARVLNKKATDNESIDYVATNLLLFEICQELQALKMLIEQNQEA